MPLLQQVQISNLTKSQALCEIPTYSQVADPAEDSKIRVIVRKRPLNVRVGAANKGIAFAVDPAREAHLNALQVSRLAELML